jgi:hypothetical protein
MPPSSGSKALIPSSTEVVRKTQIIFREVNKRIAEITSAHEEKSSEFLCECGTDLRHGDSAYAQRLPRDKKGRRALHHGYRAPGERGRSAGRGARWFEIVALVD